MNVQDEIDRQPVGFDALRTKTILSAPPGIVCEFGVAEGRYIKEIAAVIPQRTVYGFDSFEGLPEDWHAGARKGSFKCPPPTDLPANVKLVIGLFQDTLMPFLLAHYLEKFAFIHFDADIYSSTKYALTTIDPWVDGTYMMFDQIFDPVPNDRRADLHEGRAFQEYLDETGNRCEIIGRHKRDGAIFRVWRR